MGRDPGRKYEWWDVVMSEHGPPDPLDRLLLSAIAKCMNPGGGGARPSHQTLATMCGWRDRKTPMQRLKKLNGVWVNVSSRGCGKPSFYLPRVPGVSVLERTGGVRSRADRGCPSQSGHDISISPLHLQRAGARAGPVEKPDAPALEQQDQLEIPELALRLMRAAREGNTEEFDRAAEEAAQQARGGNQ